MALTDATTVQLNGVSAGIRSLDIDSAPGEENSIVDGPKPVIEEEWNPEGENGAEDENGAGNGTNAPEVSNVQAGEEAPKKKKKKKKKKSKGARKFPPPTGFEDNFNEGPLPPTVTETESELYHPSKPFTERIETCIQRYRAKRKFDPTRLQIFTSYLNLGGISTGPKAFSGGLDPKDNGDLDAEQIQKMAATEFVPAGMKDEDGDWDVDFEYVARGFLSHKVPYVLGYMRFEDLELSAKVVRNFLNYVIYHNVATEYLSSILSAIAICDLAEKELILCRQVSSRLPGKFNMACSTLFGGYYAGMKDESLTWDAGLAANVGLTNTEAEEIFIAGVEKRGSAFQKELGTRVKLLKAEFLALEVTGIVFAGTSGVKKPLPKEIEEEIKALGEEQKEKVPEKRKYNDTGLNALGRLLVKVWVPEGPEEQEEPDTDLDEFEIWVEMEVLQYCFVGMHIEAKVHQMSSGIIWIDSVTAVQCSFYLHLDSPDKDSEDEFD